MLLYRHVLLVYVELYCCISYNDVLLTSIFNTGLKVGNSKFFIARKQSCFFVVFVVVGTPAPQKLWSFLISESCEIKIFFLVVYCQLDCARIYSWIIFVGFQDNNAVGLLSAPCYLQYCHLMHSFKSVVNVSLRQVICLQRMAEALHGCCTLGHLHLLALLRDT